MHAGSCVLLKAQTWARDENTWPLCFVLFTARWRQEPAEYEVPKLSHSKLYSISKINECNKEIESNFVMIWRFVSRRWTCNLAYKPIWSNIYVRGQRACIPSWNNGLVRHEWQILISRCGCGEYSDFSFESILFSYASLAYDEPPICKAIKSAILRSPDRTFSSKSPDSSWSVCYWLVILPTLI